MEKERDKPMKSKVSSDNNLTEHSLGLPIINRRSLKSQLDLNQSNSKGISLLKTKLFPKVVLTSLSVPDTIDFKSEITIKILYSLITSNWEKIKFND